MASKEATVFVVDVGRSMGKIHNGRDVSDLDWAMKFVWNKITTAVATGRKTLAQGVILARTAGTLNDLAMTGDGYEHISVVQNLGQLVHSDIGRLTEEVKVSTTDSGDIISAIVVAIMNIQKFCKKLKYLRQIYVITDGNGVIDDEEMDSQIQEIARQLHADDIHLTVLGVDFDDPSFGFKEEDKLETKSMTETYLKQLADLSGGTFGTLGEAIRQIEIPQIKKVNIVHLFKGKLTLGDPKHEETTLSIEVERVPCTKSAKPQTAGAYSQSQQTQESVPSSAPVRNERSYRVDDPTQKKGYREVELDDLEKGYEYGRTAVPISKMDENLMKLPTYAAFEIIGFVTEEKYHRFMHQSETCVTVAAKGNERAKIALSGLIHALYELESYAVARLVPKDGRNPLIVLLAPMIEPEIECLIDVQLPFAEDCRIYGFPPLDRVITASGKELTEHRYLPTKALNQAMNDYVDAMDISSFSKDSDGNPAQYAQMEDTYSPYLHHLNDCVAHRAIYPERPLPKPKEILTKYSQPPPELLESAEKSLKTLIKTADVKKVPPRAKGSRGRDRDAEKPLSGLDVDALLAKSGKTTQIDPRNAIPDFKRILDTTTDPNGMRDAATQMTIVIEGLIKESFGDAKYGLVIACLKTLREELVDLEEPDLYNEMVRRLKKGIMGKDLGGDRRDVWYEVRRERLGLVVKQESSGSSVGEEEARKFLAAK